MPYRHRRVWHLKIKITFLSFSVLGWQWGKHLWHLPSVFAQTIRKYQNRQFEHWNALVPQDLLDADCIFCEINFIDTVKAYFEFKWTYINWSELIGKTEYYWSFVATNQIGFVENKLSTNDSDNTFHYFALYKLIQWVYIGSVDTAYILILK